MCGHHRLKLMHGLGDWEASQVSVLSDWLQVRKQYPLSPRTINQHGKLGIAMDEAMGTSYL